MLYNERRRKRGTRVEPRRRRRHFPDDWSAMPCWSGVMTTARPPACCLRVRNWWAELRACRRADKAVADKARRRTDGANKRLFIANNNAVELSRIRHSP